MSQVRVHMVIESEIHTQHYVIICMKKLHPIVGVEFSFFIYVASSFISILISKYVIECQIGHIIIGKGQVIYCFCDVALVWRLLGGIFLWFCLFIVQLINAASMEIFISPCQ